MKDEAGGRIIEAFVGLTAKLYSYKMHLSKEDLDRLKDKNEKNKPSKGDTKCKGVTKPVVKKNITHEDYKDCLFSGRKHLRTMNVIRSHKHEIFSETVNKVALSGSDDKRFIRSDKISTLSWGHYGIKKEKQTIRR